MNMSFMHTTEFCVMDTRMLRIRYILNLISFSYLKPFIKKKKALKVENWKKIQIRFDILHQSNNLNNQMSQIPLKVEFLS